MLWGREPPSSCRHSWAMLSRCLQWGLRCQGAGGVGPPPKAGGDARCCSSPRLYFCSWKALRSSKAFVFHIPIPPPPLQESVHKTIIIINYYYYYYFPSFLGALAPPRSPLTFCTHSLSRRTPHYNPQPLLRQTPIHGPPISPSPSPWGVCRGGAAHGGVPPFPPCSIRSGCCKALQHCARPHFLSSIYLLMSGKGLGGGDGGKGG